MSRRDENAEPIKRLVRYAEEHSPISVADLRRDFGTWRTEAGPGYGGPYKKGTIKQQMARLVYKCDHDPSFPLVLVNGVFHRRGATANTNANGQLTAERLFALETLDRVVELAEQCGGTDALIAAAEWLRESTGK